MPTHRITDEELVELVEKKLEGPSIEEQMDAIGKEMADMFKNELGRPSVLRRVLRVTPTKEK